MIHVEWMIGIFRVDGAEYVELCLVLLEEPDGSHDPVEGSLSAPVSAVEVVKLRRPVETETDKEVILVEEPAPFIIEENAVGLEGVFGCGCRFSGTSSGAPLTAGRNPGPSVSARRPATPLSPAERGGLP